jgi:hypothetical protein
MPVPGAGSGTGRPHTQAAACTRASGLALGPCAGAAAAWPAAWQANPAKALAAPCET